MKFDQEIFNSIFKALDGSNALAVQTGDETLKKILNDHLVSQRAQELMIAHFAARVISEMHPVEKAALLKRISPPASPAHSVAWVAEKGTQSGYLVIRGRCSRCGQDVAFSGKPDAAGAVKWPHCVLGPSTIPARVIEEYRAQYVPPSGSGRF